MNYFLTLSLFFIFSCSTTTDKPSSDWRAQSKKLSHDYAMALAEFYPEYVSKIGYSQFEELTTPYSKKFEQELYVFSYKWKSRLERMLEKEKDEEMKTDIRILLERVSLEMDRIELYRDKGVVSFVPVTEFIFQQLKELLYKEAPTRKINNALLRFRTYVKGDEEQLPLVDGVTAYTLNQLNHLENNRKRGFWPTREEIEIYLKNSDTYLNTIEELLTSTRKTEWKSDLAELRIQETQYRDFLKKKILPYARKDQKTPYALYAFTLKDMGIKESPEKLIEIGKDDYRQIYQRFVSLAREIANDQGLSESDPVSVIRHLMKKKISDQDELLVLYMKTNSDLFKIVTENDLITINKTPNLIIRFATPAESQSLPAPHFISAPFFGKDKDRPGQFVITPADGGRDDFSFPEAAITLSAHEAIPGHGLQYHMMRERGTTLIRSLFAFNSVNVEGWGLYAEDIVFPYLSKEAQLITLQRKLWRVARMFLDPALNLGKIKSQAVLEVFTKELGFSDLFAQSELKRYSYIMPGQANSYYYGYKELMKMKAGFTNQKCFNDAILNFGILPLSEISTRLKKVSCEAP
jgi:hypothetical protein